MGTSVIPTILTWLGQLQATVGHRQKVDTVGEGNKDQMNKGTVGSPKGFGGGPPLSVPLQLVSRRKG